MASMNRETRETTIGAVTLAAFALVFLLVSGRADSTAPASDEFYRVKALFSRVDGLLPGDEVRLGGIKVGVVESAVIDKAYHAVLTLAVNKEVPLPLDTSAAIHTNGLFGSKFIVLEPGGDFDYLAEGDEIMFTQGSVVVEELLDLIISEGKAKQADQNKAQ